MQMKNVFVVMGIASCVGHASADLYRVTVSGVVESVVDNRTSQDDVFDGTVWDVDSFSVSEGDSWVYEIVYNTDVMPDPFNDQGDHQYAIYSGFESTLSLGGQTMSINTSITNFENGVVEIFTGTQLSQGSFDVYMFFLRNDGLGDLINGGALPSSEAFFDDLNLFFFWITDQNRFEVNGASEFSVSVEQIPAPGSLGVLGFGGLLAARRRR